MNIVVTGASGFLGKSLITYFKNLKCNVIPVYRKDFINRDLLYEKLKNSDVIINLAGETIIQKWNNKAKNRILTSRIDTTNKIVNYLNNYCSDIHLINTSAVGIYSNSNEYHDESSTSFANNFLYHVVKEWETEATKLDTTKNSLSVIRLGVVLGNVGGAFNQYYRLTKYFLNGIIGRGSQGISFIHIDDFCRSVNFIINKKIHGIINLTSPNPTSNKIFTKTLGKLLNRPIFLIIPGFIFRIIFGKSHVLFTEGQYVIPKVLTDYGFKFNYSNIGDSFKALIKSYPK